jgi:hypothetical protein
VTAAFSHVDLLHLVFNMMSVFSLGGLEEVRSWCILNEAHTALLLAHRVVWCRIQEPCIESPAAPDLQSG